MVFKPITWPVSLVPLRVDNKLTLLLSQVAKTELLLTIFIQCQAD